MSKSLLNIWRSMVSLQIFLKAVKYFKGFKFFKGCLPQILLGPFLNTSSRMSLIKNNFLTFNLYRPLLKLRNRNNEYRDFSVNLTILGCHALKSKTIRNNKFMTRHLIKISLKCHDFERYSAIKSAIKYMHKVNHWNTIKTVKAVPN